MREHSDVLDTYANDIVKLNDAIHDNLITTNDMVSEEEYERCQEYKDKITRCLTSLRLATTPIPAHTNSHNSNPSLLRSPIAPLPRFTSADGEDLTRFLIEFEDTLSKYNYSQYDQLLLLKQQLSGRALTLVNSLESDKQGYKHAKSLLVEALASEEVQTFNVIKQLTELKLPLKAEPFEYISRVRLLSESVKKLDVKEQHIL